MEIITENGKSYLHWGVFIHSESGRPLHALSALYEPYPQLLASKLAAVLDDWSGLVMPATSVPPGLYRHFKGGSYKVFGEFVDVRSREPCVAYVGLYGGYARLVRPTAMFTEHVVKPEYRYEGPRFVLIRPC